jgi:hypothetical protein
MDGGFLKASLPPSSYWYPKIFLQKNKTNANTVSIEVSFDEKKEDF